MPKSVKRGIAYDLENPEDLAALAPGVSWWYRWALRPANGVPADYRSRYDMDFIPMLWNGNFNQADVEAFLRANPNIKYLLLLNEPNLTDQANMTPQQAAQLWPRYEAVAENTGVQLVGPAMTWGTMTDFEDPVVWLDAFYAEYRAANGGREPRIDYLAFHWYDYGLAGQLDRLTKYGKSFWVTEFANWHRGAGPHIDSVAKQKEQMTEMVAVCESRDDVFRYAWFTGRWPDEANRHTSLLGATGQLTELGEHYLAQPYWVGTWIDPASSGKVSRASFDKQTLRQVVRTSVSGSTVRVRLSNKLGTDAVTVSNVHIARRDSDASIDAATDRTITFGGRSSVSLPAGSEMYSDPLVFAVPSQAEVAISFYLPQATVVTSSQSPTAAQLTTYVANGDVSGSADFAVVQRSDGYRLLASLEVQGRALRGSAATLGGSIAAGNGLEDASQSWPNLLAKRLSAENIHVGVLNQDRSAATNGGAVQAKSQSATSVFQQPNLRWLIYADAAFDKLHGAPSYDQLIAPLQETIEQARRQQVKLLCSTLTPFEGHPGWSTDAERVRRTYNALVRQPESGCDAVIDQDRALRDPSRPAKLLPMYDSGDHLHPNAAGHRAITNSIDLNVFLTPIVYTNDQ